MSVIKFTITSSFPEDSIKEFAIDNGWDEKVFSKKLNQETGQQELIDNPDSYLDFVTNFVHQMLFEKISQKRITEIHQQFALQMQEEIRNRLQPLQDAIKVEYQNLSDEETNKQAIIDELEEVEEIKEKPTLLQKIIRVIWK